MKSVYSATWWRRNSPFPRHIRDELSWATLVCICSHCGCFHRRRLYRLLPRWAPLGQVCYSREVRNQCGVLPRPSTYPVCAAQQGSAPSRAPRGRCPSRARQVWGTPAPGSEHQVLESPGRRRGCPAGLLLPHPRSAEPERGPVLNPSSP